MTSIGIILIFSLIGLFILALFLTWKYYNVDDINDDLEDDPETSRHFARPKDE